MRASLLKLFRRPAFYAFALILGVVFLAVFIGSRERDNPTPADHAPAVASATVNVAETEDLRLLIPPGAFDIPGEIDAPPAVKLKSYARTIRLQILNSEDLSLNTMAGELLDLDPIQVEKVNSSLKRFMDRLQVEEVANASVVVGPQGDEEIVVTAFDKKKFVNALRDDIARSIDADVAAFIVDQLAFDNTVAIADSEMRVGIETGEDGADRLTFTRRVQVPEAVDEYTPYEQGGIRFAATWSVNTAALLKPTIEPRLAHLFAAQHQLPRKERTVGPEAKP